MSLYTIVTILLPINSKRLFYRPTDLYFFFIYRRMLFIVLL